jgi:uncharacterized protein YjbI with pentapeptide repeats
MTNFKGANLLGANLINAFNLEAEQLAGAKTLYQAQLDEPLQEEIKTKYPYLLDKSD